MKGGAAEPQERKRHAVSKLRRAVSRKIAITDWKRCSIATEFESKKTASKRRIVDKTRCLWLHSIHKRCGSR